MFMPKPEEGDRFLVGERGDRFVLIIIIIIIK
jgi:hypothetical protein